MNDLPENNLQIIKREPSPFSTPEGSPNDIRAKLNLHVKRRIQDHEAEIGIANENTKSHKQQPKEVRHKRPYHKRTDKTKSVVPTNDLVPTTSQRKFKSKLKQVVTGNPDALTPNSQDDNIHAGANSGGEEDDSEIRMGREKEKCPDVLSMVLSMKKRALMQEPEVQKFLADIVNVIKS